MCMNISLSLYKSLSLSIYLSLSLCIYIYIYRAPERRPLDRAPDSRGGNSPGEVRGFSCFRPGEFRPRDEKGGRLLGSRSPTAGCSPR